MGLFMPQRVDDFREMMNQFPEAKVLNVDFNPSSTATAHREKSLMFFGGVVACLVGFWFKQGSRGEMADVVTSIRSCEAL
jgi:hypothetical protein